MVFICLMGVVSLFADMTQEGARSIFGDYLGLMGASAATIGFIAGFGELVGYALRIVTGFIANRSGKYWAMTVIGYSVAVLAIPCLSFVPDGNWMLAAVFIVMGRMGKAIRQPAKNTLLSYAATQKGLGKSFAIQEFLDQLGAFLGPVFIFLVLSYAGNTDGLRKYSLSFLALGIPALCCIGAVLFAKMKFPNPEDFEPEVKEQEKFRINKYFIGYMAGACLFAFGFIDFPLITMHAVRVDAAGGAVVPLLYAAAMIVDAFSALFFGWLFDKYGVKSLIWSTLAGAPFVYLVFAGTSSSWIYAGVVLWGIGMGAQESTLKAAVSAIVPKHLRAAGYGIFETCFGITWFLGSFLLGALYDRSIMGMIAVSTAAQLLAIPFFLYAGKAKNEAAA